MSDWHFCSHIDIFNTVLESVGVPLQNSTANARSRSLLSPLDGDRVTCSEYHTIGSRSGIFMLQDAMAKYVHYCDHPPEFFDLEQDPDELVNLADRPDQQERLAMWEARLRELCDPSDVDLRAKHRQRELIEFFGGEEAIRAGSGIGGYTPSPIG